jgi:hypothetical protein
MNLLIRLSTLLVVLTISLASFSQNTKPLNIDTSKLGSKNELGFYSYKTDSGYIAVDYLGNLLYDQAYNDITFNLGDDSAAVVSKGDWWGFFSLNDKYNFPLAKIKDPWSTFELDDYSYSYLQTDYFVEIDGKFGKVNYQNTSIISPNYNKLYSMGKGMSVGLKDESWHFIVDSNETIVHSFNIDEWIGVRSIDDITYALIVRHDSLIFKDLDKFKEYHGLDLFNKKHKQKTVFNDDGYSGVVNDKGDIILPFQFNWITIHSYNKEKPYIIAKKKHFYGMYTIDGEIRNEHIYKNMSSICNGGETYFRIQKDGFYAAAKRNEKGKLIPITDFVFKSISCNSTKEGEPIATGYYKKYTEPTTYIYADGKIETKE